jgi:hypothetical protein
MSKFDQVFVLGSGAEVNVDWIKAIIQGLVRKRFYGRLTVYFEAGRIVRAEKLESLRPEG